MWMPVTPGEEVFLALYKESECEESLHFIGGLNESLISPKRFHQFTRLSATLEVFIRTLGEAKLLCLADPDGQPKYFRSGLNASAVTLPRAIHSNEKFWESLKQATVNLCNEDGLRKGLQTLSSAVYKNNHAHCYLCGVLLTRTTDSRSHRSVDHLWPICLGGSNSLDNLVPACVDCNTSRNETVTWAWGPVASTRLKKSDANPPKDLRLSMGLARMMLYAERFRSRHGVTLKSTLSGIFPACAELGLRDDRHEAYFEIFNRMEEQVWRLNH